MKLACQRVVLALVGGKPQPVLGPWHICIYNALMMLGSDHINILCFLILDHFKMINESFVPSKTRHQLSQ